MGQHGAAFVRHGQQVAMTLLAFGIVERRVGGLPVFLAVVCFDGKMLDHVFDTVKRFGEKEVKCFVGCGQVAIHAVGDESLGVVHMGGCTPGNHRGLDLMAGRTELGGGSPHHRVEYVMLKRGKATMIPTPIRIDASTYFFMVAPPF